MFLSWVVLGYYLAPFLLLPSCQAYRVGDAVDTFIHRLDAHSTTSEALRAQMPTFGRDTSVRFSYRTDPQADAETPLSKSFALEFEDGLWLLPAVPLRQRGTNAPISSWPVTFVYSRSGITDGYIHTVRAGEPEYDPVAAVDEASATFRVEYKWLQEEPVQWVAGQAVMYCLVFLTSLVILLSVCSMSSTLEEGQQLSATNGGPSSLVRPLIASSGEPKYD